MYLLLLVALVNNLSWFHNGWEHRYFMIDDFTAIAVGKVYFNHSLADHSCKALPIKTYPDLKVIVHQCNF